MDNSAFRNLVSKSSQNGSNGTTSSAGPGGTGFKKPAALGSRARSMIPMTPRNIPGQNHNREFARQVAEQASVGGGEPPLKKFKSSAAPKGTKLGKGYVDRSALRQGHEEEDDKAERLKNLEEQLKLSQIDQAQFEMLREQIGVGGDVSSTHLVKGLDWKLLERVRKGEDVAKRESSNEREEEQTEVDVDDELEQALEKDVVARERSKAENTEEQVQEPQQILTRDEILRQFRQQRHAPAALAAPVLNDRFKKVASSEKSGKKKFVETVNGRRREVLVITNKDGTTKRKTRWIDPEGTTKTEQQPMGMEVPTEVIAKQKALLEAEAEAEADENEDIFADAGGDYDPLAGIDSEEDESGEEREITKADEAPAPNPKRNYFSTGKTMEEETSNADKPASTDPTILAALKRAAEIRKCEEVTETQPGGQGSDQLETNGNKSSAFLAKLKESERQDAADLDYGFGESRFGDDDDDDNAGLLYDDEEGEKKKTGRKRGPKKRKGDKDSAQDVMNVLESRKTKG